MNLVVDPEGLDAATAALRLKFPVRVAILDADDARAAGHEPDIHGSYYWDDDAREHVVSVMKDSFGLCDHKPNATALHELIHAFQVEIVSDDPRNSREIMANIEHITGYDDCPFELNAQHGMREMCKRGHKVVREA